MDNGKLCFSCFDDNTFQLFGQTPEVFTHERRRYIDAIYEGLAVDCGHCGRIAKYARNAANDKWVQSYELNDKEWPI